MPAQHSAIHDSGAQGPAVAPADDLGTLDADLPGHVEQTLADYLGIRVGECVDLDPGFAAAAREMTTFVLGGGKRIRPTFAWWGRRACGGAATGPEAASMLHAASALELLQACALVHDDLIDESDTRRGKPTVHRRFEAMHRDNDFVGDGARFGMAAAVLLGDLALAWSDDMLHSSGIGAEAMARALRPWRAMRTEVLSGQYLDVLGQARIDETPEAALRICELKSASYSVQRPLELGAQIAGAGREALAALHRFGTAAARERGDDASLHLLQGVLGDPDLDQDRVAAAREALESLGAVSAVDKRIAELTGSAMLALHAAGLDEPAASRLAELAVAVTDRTH